MSEKKEPEQVKVSPWKYKVVYKWWGGILRWVFGPALKPLISDLIVMIMETRDHLEFHEKHIHRMEDGGALKVEEEVTINTGLKPDMGEKKEE